MILKEQKRTNMERILQTEVDHTRLLRGVFVARMDKLAGGGVITTFDIRMKLPNREPSVSQGALHTIDHLAKHFLSRRREWSDRILYWGPMCSCTGYNLLVEGECTSQEIVPLLVEMFDYIAEYYDEIPEANAVACGNYTLNNLPMARWEARKFLVEVLQNLSDQNLNYPL